MIRSQNLRRGECSDAIRLSYRGTITRYVDA